MIEGAQTAVLFSEAMSPLLVDFPFERNYVESIIRVSLYVSLTAVVLSTLVAVPIAMAARLPGNSENPTAIAIGTATSVLNTTAVRLTYSDTRMMLST